MRKTKIVCTLGPATDKEGVLREMMLSGMNVARFNFSHGTHSEHKVRLDAVKALREEDQKLISLRYDGELTMEEMGKLLGVSKMAVSKRLKKLHQTLKSSVV